MLDTIILQIEKNKCHITDYGKFGTTSDIVSNTTGVFKKWVNNPNAKDKKDGIYKPRLTLIKRGFRFYLKIEFSAQSLLFKNPLDELEESDFDEEIKTLQKRLKEMGVMVWTKNIEGAEVLSFHPAKNMPLGNGFTANFAIRELKKVDISKNFDVDIKEYRNNGEALQIYSRSHSLVFYDKVCDLNKPQKRAIGKDQTSQQKTIFDFIKTDHLKLEVLRMEARLSTKRKMNFILKKIGFKQNPTFKDILNKDLCQKILNQYWDDIFSNNQFIFSTISNPQDVLQLIFRKHPKIKAIKAINIVGLYMLGRDDEGMRGFRQIVDSYKPKTNWIAVKKYLEVLADEIFSNSPWEFITDIKRELKEFKPFKLKIAVDGGVDKPFAM